MDQDDGDLLRPFLSPVTTPPASSPSSSTIIFRISFLFFIGTVSIWANHEASKGFAVKIINEAGDTIAGKRFHLFYESNDEATRTLFRASKIVEEFLYSDLNYKTKKPVNAVVLKLMNKTVTQNDVVESNFLSHEFVINLSLSVMEGANSNQALFSAVLRGVTRIWLWNGQGHSPRNLIAGIVEYIAAVPSSQVAANPKISTAAWWMEEDPRILAESLSFIERRRRGFIAKLNAAMKDGWEKGASEMCRTYELAAYNSSSVGYSR